MIFSDPYYGNVQIDEQDLDNKTIKKLITVLKKKLIQFDKKIETMREQAASEIFDKPLKNITD